MNVSFTSSLPLDATSDERSWQAKSLPGLYHLRRAKDGSLYLCWGRQCVAVLDPASPWLRVDLTDENGMPATAPVPPPVPLQEAPQAEAAPQPPRQRRTRQNGS